jgi:trk system potassium uptake protein TrkH
MLGLVVEVVAHDVDPLPDGVRRLGGSVALLLACTLSVAVILETSRRRLADGLRALSLAATGAIVAPALGGRPALAFAMGLLALGFLLLPAVARRLRTRGARPMSAPDGGAFLRGALVSGLVTWVIGGPGGLAVDTGTRVITTAGVLIPVGLGILALWRARGPLRRGAAVLLAISSVAALAVPHPEIWIGLLLFPVWPPRPRPAWTGSILHSRPTGLIEAALGEPTRILVTTFLLAGLVGGAVLALPAAASGERIALLDAMFTAFSATCVTGLVVVDTPVAYSKLGESVILLLIQIGGLGIVTFSTAAFVLIRRRLSLSHERAMASLLPDRAVDFRHALGQVFRLTILFELVGSAVLAIAFLAHGDDLGQAVWRGVFTAVSAYCNAGFALQTDSLVPYQHDGIVLHTVALLIVAGGLGPAVVAALPALAKRRPTSVHVRVVLLASVVLLVLPAVFFIAVEWGHALAHLSPAERIHNAWFQSVTLRTAGFNSIDLQTLRPVTWTVMMALMFIGGSPASTAGGIKTTTFAVLLAGTWSAVRGHGRVRMFGHELPAGTLRSALAVALLGAVCVGGGTLALQLTQRGSLTDLAYESISAAGTVGLSLGATARLDDVGKLIVMAVLFAGRVGPLSLAIFLMGRQRRSEWSRPEQDIAIG